MRIIKTWEGHGMVKQNEYATIIAKHSHENKVAFLLHIFPTLIPIVKYSCFSIGLSSMYLTSIYHPITYTRKQTSKKKNGTCKFNNILSQAGPVNQ